MDGQITPPRGKGPMGAYGRGAGKNLAVLRELGYNVETPNTTTTKTSSHVSSITSIASSSPEIASKAQPSPSTPPLIKNTNPNSVHHNSTPFMHGSM